MSLHKVHDDPFEVYFCTITCHDWLPLFQESQAYPTVYRWFQYIVEEGCNVAGFVIMPNHLHVLIYLGHGGTTINKLVGEGKRFMAYGVVRGLKKNNKVHYLTNLQDAVSAKEKLKGKLHQIFKPSFDAKICRDEEAVEQYLGYMHANPVTGEWNLVDDITSYPHSSAAYYELGKENEYLTHYKELSA